jgi:hypothetical protein
VRVDSRVEQTLRPREYVATRWLLSCRGILPREPDGAACRILDARACGDDRIASWRRQRPDGTAGLALDLWSALPMSEPDTRM